MPADKVSQKLIDIVATDMRAGKDIIAIQKSLLKSDFSASQIHEAYRLISIAGPENAGKDFLQRLKQDKLYLKQKSGLAIYFNIICCIILFSLFTRIYVIYGWIGQGGGWGIIFWALIAGLALEAAELVGVYYGRIWGLIIFAFSLFSGIRTVIEYIAAFIMGNDIFTKGSYLWVLDIVFTVGGIFCLVKIMKKYGVMLR